MAKVISNIAKGARIAVIASVSSLILSSVAVAATCAQVPDIKLSITSNQNIYHCNNQNRAEPECGLLLTIDACCLDPSSVVAEACLCNGINLGNTNYDNMQPGFTYADLCTG